MAEIRFDDVTKQFEDGTLAVDRLDLTIDDGEFMVLVGPSGCGKTTSLRMVAGLEDLTSGEIRIGDEVVNDLPAKRRDIAMVFQNYALYPHMSVAQNMGFGLRLRGVPRAERDHRVREAAAVLDLTELLDRRPRQLSGGQRQRVAMGRAIVREPRAFLMDEPLSNLDAKLRVQMRAEIARIQQRLRVTTLYVTHDQVEAMTMGDRVAVMRRGILQQVAPPTVLYERPVNLFVAGFIGSPAMNLLEAVVRIAEDAVWLDVGSQSILLDASLVSGRPTLRRYDAQTVALGIRPEHLQDVALSSGVPVERRITARVELVESLGSDVIVHGSVTATPVRSDDSRELADDVDAVARTELSRSTTAAVIARCDPRSVVRPGDVMTLAVDTSRVQLFDLATSAAIV